MKTKMTEAAKPTHTPGPWSFYPDKNTGVIMIMRPHPLDEKPHEGGDGMVISEIRKGWGPSAANARLIAAAPDLLAALKKMTALLAAHPDGGLYPDYLIQARAAIAKAEG